MLVWTGCHGSRAQGSVKLEDGPAFKGYGHIVMTTPRGTTAYAVAGGNNFGFHSSLMRYPEEHDTVIVIRSNKGSDMERADQVQAAMIPVLFATK